MFRYVLCHYQEPRKDEACANETENEQEELGMSQLSVKMHTEQGECQILPHNK